MSERPMKAGRTPRRSPQAPVTRARTFRVEVTLVAEITIDERVFAIVRDPEWQRQFYQFELDAEVVQHLAYNLLQERRFTSLDGFADLEEKQARITRQAEWVDWQVDEKIKGKP